jgi:hypothetical protein
MNNEPIFVIAHGGGNPAAATYAGELAAIQDNLNPDFRNMKAVVSSAGIIPILMAVTSAISGEKISYMAGQMIHDLQNSKVSAGPKAAGEALLNADHRRFSLWDRKKYAQAMAHTFSVPVPGHDLRRKLKIVDLINSGIEVSILFTLHNKLTKERSPFVLNIDHNLHPRVWNADVGYLAAVAMSFPGLLPRANNFLIAAEVKLPGYTGIPEHIDVVDADITIDQTYRSEHQTLSPSELATLTLVDKGAQNIHWFQIMNENENLPLLSAMALSLMAGVKSFRRIVPHHIISQSGESLNFIKHCFDLPAGYNPIDFSKNAELYAYGYEHGLAYVTELQSPDSELGKLR